MPGIAILWNVLKTKRCLETFPISFHSCGFLMKCSKQLTSLIYKENFNYDKLRDSAASNIPVITQIPGFNRFIVILPCVYFNLICHSVLFKRFSFEIFPSCHCFLYKGISKHKSHRIEQFHKDMNRECGLFMNNYP